MHNILLVDDSLEAFQLVKRAVGNFVHLDWAKSQDESFKTIEDKSFDLILLDIMLPDGDGYRLCSVLQTDEQMKNVPVIFLSAKNSVSDKVFGFSVGAEDFITKPFDPVELKTRIGCRLRKRDREKMMYDIIRIGDIEINKSTQTVQVFEQSSAEVIYLTPIEFKILLFLCRTQNKVFSRDEVLNAVWGENIHVYPRSVDTHVSKLRKKLGAKASYIRSVHGTGYRFAIDEQPHLSRIDLAPHIFVH